MVIAIACLFLIVIFPSEDAFQSLIVGVSFFLIVPWLYIKIILREPIYKFGLSFGDMRKGILWSLFSFAIFSLSVYLAYQQFNFFGGYQLPRSILTNFWMFVVYEVFLVGSFLFLYEFFFHGWLLNFLERYFGIASVILQFIVFVVFLAVAGDFSWNFFPYIIINLFGGWTAYKSQSIWYSFVSGWITIVLLDMIFLKLA